MKTQDIYLASTLIYLGYNCDVQTGSGRMMWFIFDEEVKDSVEQYYNREIECEPSGLMLCMKQLKRRVYSISEGK